MYLALLFVCYAYTLSSYLIWPVLQLAICQSCKIIYPHPRNMTSKGETKLSRHVRIKPRKNKFREKYHKTPCEAITRCNTKVKPKNLNFFLFLFHNLSISQSPAATTPCHLLPFLILSILELRIPPQHRKATHDTRVMEAYSPCL
jgi:hypothetical protein